MSEQESLQYLLSVGFSIGYAPCNGRWVKCYVPPNSIGPILIPEQCNIENLPFELKP